MVAQTHADNLVPNVHISAIGGHILTPAEIESGASARGKATAIRLSQVIEAYGIKAGEAYCDYCGKVFHPTRKNNQYCDPKHERQKQIIRKENLIITLACHLEAWGYKATDMVLLARKMVSEAYKGVMRALEAFGYRWVQSRKQWVLKPNLATKKCKA